MISALMYAMVFMACFGGTARFKDFNGASGPVSVESRESGGLRHPGSKDRGGMGGTGRAGIGYGFPGTGTPG